MFEKISSFILQVLSHRYTTAWIRDGINHCISICMFNELPTNILHHEGHEDHEVTNLINIVFLRVLRVLRGEIEVFGWILANKEPRLKNNKLRHV
jgi:hypothetical protein